MRVERQTVKEIEGRKVSNFLAVEIDGFGAGAGIAARDILATLRSGLIGPAQEEVPAADPKVPGKII